jgi:hypothetical protein
MAATTIVPAVDGRLLPGETSRDGWRMSGSPASVAGLIGWLAGADRSSRTQITAGLSVGERHVKARRPLERDTAHTR